MKNNEKGFSAIEILIVLAVIALIGGISWYVWQNNGNTSDEQSTSQTTESPTEDNATEDNINQEPYTYTFDELGIRMDILGGWEVTTNHTQEEGISFQAEEEPINFYEWTVKKPGADGEIRLASIGFGGGFRGCDDRNPLSRMTINEIIPTQNPDLLIMVSTRNSDGETRTGTSIVPADATIYRSINDVSAPKVQFSDMEAGDYFYCSTEPGARLELNDEPIPNLTRIDSITARASDTSDNQYSGLSMDAESYEDIKTMLTSIE